MNKWFYKTPEGFSDILLRSDGTYLTGLCFVGSRDACRHTENCEERKLPVFDETIKWLDIYFAGNEPEFTPKYKIENLTAFRREVMDIMRKIPYGEIITYGDIAKEIAKKRGIEKMSAQAVGGAVGWNPLCLIIPCHRVMGANGAITGYGGGIHNKIALLELEHRNRKPYSGKVMEKCGMKYEGTLRSADFNNQGVCDACYYALLKSDK